MRMIVGLLPAISLCAQMAFAGEKCDQAKRELPRIKRESKAIENGINSSRERLNCETTPIPDIQNACQRLKTLGQDQLCAKFNEAMQIERGVEGDECPGLDRVQNSQAMQGACPSTS